MTRPITVEVPEEAMNLLGKDAEQFGHEMLLAAVLRWFEEGRLSQGQAAQMLGLKRERFFDVLYEHKISPVQMSIKDLEEDFPRG